VFLGVICGLGGLLRNPELRPLVGGVQAVTLGDKEANASNNGQKVRRSVLHVAFAACRWCWEHYATRRRWHGSLSVVLVLGVMQCRSAAI
jgi:hypothetical protein